MSGDVVDIDSPKPPPPGLCDACGRDVDVDRFVTRPSDPGKNFHRDHVGQTCGPVFTRFAYRVFVWTAPPGEAGRLERHYLTRQRPISDQAHENSVAGFIARSYKAVGPDGALVVGAHPYVGFLWCELVAAE